LVQTFFLHVWWICVHPLVLLLFGFKVHKWNTSFITCCLYDVIEKSVTIFVQSFWRGQYWSHSLHFVWTCENSWNPSCAKLVTV
jgi:hypothetical protein